MSNLKQKEKEKKIKQTFASPSFQFEKITREQTFQRFSQKISHQREKRGERRGLCDNYKGEESKNQNRVRSKRPQNKTMEKERERERETEELFEHVDKLLETITSCVFLWSDF